MPLQPVRDKKRNTEVNCSAWMDGCSRPESLTRPQRGGRMSAYPKNTDDVRSRAVPVNR